MSGSFRGYGSSDSAEEKEESNPPFSVDFSGFADTLDEDIHENMKDFAEIPQNPLNSMIQRVEAQEEEGVSHHEDFRNLGFTENLNTESGVMKLAGGVLVEETPEETHEVPENREESKVENENVIFWYLKSIFSEVRALRSSVSELSAKIDAQEQLLLGLAESKNVSSAAAHSTTEPAAPASQDVPFVCPSARKVDFLYEDRVKAASSGRFGPSVTPQGQRAPSIFSADDFQKELAKKQALRENKEKAIEQQRIHTLKLRETKNALLRTLIQPQTNQGPTLFPIKKNESLFLFD